MRQILEQRRLAEPPLVTGRHLSSPPEELAASGGGEEGGRREGGCHSTTIIKFISTAGRAWRCQAAQVTSSCSRRQILAFKKPPFVLCSRSSSSLSSSTLSSLTQLLHTRDWSLVSRALFKSFGLISDLEGFLLGIFSVSDWTEFWIKSSEGSTNITILTEKIIAAAAIFHCF